MRLNTKTWTFLLVSACVLALALAKSSSRNDDSSEDDETAKALRRSEISRALGLLKKHSVVGKNAKIVLKTSGRHLLVDPSERLQVVTSHSSDLKAAANSITKSSKLSTSKASSKMPSSASKSTTRKRASRANSKVTPLPASVSAIQKQIMESAASRSPTVVDSLMGATLLDEVTRLVSAIVRNRRAHSLVELSDLITETLDERFGPHWHTVSVATASTTNNNNQQSNEVLVRSAKEQQEDSLTHVAVDDHRKTATFYATYDFGRTLRVYVFK